MGTRIEDFRKRLRTRIFALLLLIYWLCFCGYVWRDGYRLLVYGGKLDIERANFVGSGIVLALGIGYSIVLFWGKARSLFSPLVALVLNLILTYMLFQFMLVTAR